LDISVEEKMRRWRRGEEGKDQNEEKEKDEDKEEEEDDKNKRRRNRKSTHVNNPRVSGLH
jgi:hypothetical protein